MTETHIRTASRIAYLNTAEDREDSAGWTIHGTALGADELTNGHVNGEPQQVEWPADVLEEGASTLEGKPIIDVHSDDDDGQIQYPPPAEITVGKVTRVGFDADVGILYEATLADEELAQKIEAGVLTVSPEIGFQAEEDGDVLRATGIVFAGLAVVSVGGSDAASAAAGPNEALAQATLSAAGVDALLESSAPDDPTPGSSEGEVADGSTDTVTETRPAESGADNGSTDNMGDNNPTVSELLDRIDEKDEQIATLKEEKAEIEETNTDLEERNATLEEENDEVKEAYAAVLATEDSPFTEDDLVERFDVATLRERFEDRFEDGFAATLSEPDVQSGSDPDGGSGDGLNTDDATLEEARDLAGRASMLETVDADYAATLREQAVDAVGADDFDAVLEVLD